MNNQTAFIFSLARKILILQFINVTQVVNGYSILNKIKIMKCLTNEFHVHRTVNGMYGFRFVSNYGTNHY